MIPFFLSVRNIGLLNANIVCEGNSLTLGNIGGFTPYPTQLAGLQPILDNNCVVSNIGDGGDTTTNLISDPSEVQENYNSNNRSNILVFWEGRNDLVVEEVTVNQSYNNLITFCQARKAEGWRVVILTLLPSWTYPYKGDTTVSGYLQLDADRKAVNNLIRSGYTGFADGLCDVASIGEIDDLGENEQAGYTYSAVRPTTSDNGYYYDGTHMTTSGYGLIANKVLETLQALKL